MQASTKPRHLGGFKTGCLRFVKKVMLFCLKSDGYELTVAQKGSK